LQSRRYAEDFNQVKELGSANSTTRTADQAETARFWADFSYTATPPGHWNEIAAKVAVARNLSLIESARLFALLNITLADAAIVCWESKYVYDFWRPITAIRMADDDDNPATVADPNWNSLLNAPPFPEYTSGHSTFSQAAAVVLANFFRSDEISFTVGNDTLPGVARSYPNFSAAADESGMSRIYGGIHFFSANRDGKACGAALANYVTRFFLQASSDLPKLAFIPSAPGQVRLQLHGLVGTQYVIEGSTDYRQWMPISTNRAVGTGTLIHASLAGNPSMYFFRARALDPGE
jgi:hypothetical protein